MPIHQQTLTILNTHGLHVRPCAALAEIAQKSKCKVTVSKDGISANAARIIELLTLGAAHGERILIVADGEDSQEVIKKIEELVAIHFGVHEE